MAVREPSGNDVNAYLQWVLFAVYGLLGDADGMMHQHGASIRLVAAWLRAAIPVKPGTVYRGLLLDPSLLRAGDGLVDVDPNYTFLSYTEDKNVACWFADRESTISKSVAERYADASGYIAKRRPRQADILFHYSWGLAFPFAGRRIPLWVIAAQDPRMDPRQIEQWLKTQQEVILEPVTEPYPVTPFEDECPSDPDVLEDLDRRLTGRQFAHEVKRRKWHKVDGVYVKKNPRAKITFSDEDVEAMVAAYEGGASIATVGKQHGVGGAVARRTLVAAGVEIRSFDARPQRYVTVSDEDVRAMVAAYEGGASLGEVGKQHGVNPLIVRRNLVEAGVEIRVGDSGRSARSKELHAAIVADYLGCDDPVAKVGMRHGVKAQTVKEALQAAGVEPRAQRTMKPGRWRSSWGRNPQSLPQDYESPVYHVTYSGLLPLIAEQGLQPDRGPGMGRKYETHRKGAVFLTDPDGLSFWHERAEEWANHDADDLLAEGVVPVVLRAWTDVPCKLDEIGSHDAKAPAWKCLGVVPPEELELWSGDGWVPVSDYEGVDFSRAVDDEGYLAVYSENELVPTAADMSFAAKVNPRRRPSRRTTRTRAQTRAQRRATQRARLRRLLRTI